MNIKKILLKIAGGFFLTRAQKAITLVANKYGEDLTKFSFDLNGGTLSNAQKLDALRDQVIALTLSDGLVVNKDIAKAVAQTVYVDGKDWVEDTIEDILAFFKKK